MTDAQTVPEEGAPTPEAAAGVTIRRRLLMPALLAGFAGLVAVAFLVRGVADASVWSSVVGLVLAGVAFSQALVLRDGRTPLLLADEHGVRLRLGRDWCGLPWQTLRQVVVEPSTSKLSRSMIQMRKLTPSGT